MGFSASGAGAGASAGAGAGAGAGAAAGGAALACCPSSAYNYYLLLLLLSLLKLWDSPLRGLPSSISLREAGGWVWVSAGASGAQEAACASTSVVVGGI